MRMSTLHTLLAAVTLLAVSAADAQPRSVDIPLGNGTVALTLIELKPGTFTMGSPKEEAHRRTNETQHAVTLSKPFWLGRTEVTQAQWQAVTGKPSPAKNQGNEQLPVDNVSWDEATQFCQTLTEQARKAGHIPANARFTLPTEAQWEYACRAGTTTPFAFGASLEAKQANFDGNHPYGTIPAAPRFLNATAPVASYQPNAWGFHDMHGNVLEWCADRYQADLGAAPVTDPAGPADSPYRVYRGGNYRDIAAFCRSAFRYFNLPHFKYAYLGFRVALVAD